MSPNVSNFKKDVASSNVQYCSARLESACQTSAIDLHHEVLLVANIDPLPPSTTPARDIVPIHNRRRSPTPILDTVNEERVGSISANNSPSRSTRIPSTSGTPTLIPATRTRSHLEGDGSNATLTPHSSGSPPDLTFDSSLERPPKRQRIHSISASTEGSSSISLSAIDRSLFSDDHIQFTASMRVLDNGHDSSSSVSPDLPPEAGPSSIPAIAKNGLAANGSVNGFSGSLFSNGVSRHAKPTIPTVKLPGTTLYEDSYIDREEYIRLVIQSLRDVGYIESAATLEAESGYVMETPEVADFRQCILDGAWSAAEAALHQLCATEDDGLWEAKFLISRQKYLELLELGRITAALHVLRNELAPLHIDPEQLLPLSSLVMCTDAADLKQRADWDGAHGSSRRRLLGNLQRKINLFSSFSLLSEFHRAAWTGYIPSSVMIPPRRFSTLLEQARLYQRSECIYHNAPATLREFSLYNDHRCERDFFPRFTTAILEVHTDEVWSLEWSHDGRWLASASKDHSVIIWSIGTEAEPSIRRYSPELILRDHPFHVGCIAWSLDDSILLSASEQYIKMWNTKTGVCLRTLEAHTETVSALAWVPDGSGFISGSQDRKIILWGADGKQRDSWGITAIRIVDLAVTPDFTRLVVVGESATGISSGNPSPPGRGESTTPPVASGRGAGVHANANSARKAENRMIVYDLATKRQEMSIAFEAQITSVKISEDSRYALINHAPDELQLWDISTGRMTRKYNGQRQGNFIIRSCFGGVDENFVHTRLTVLSLSPILHVIYRRKDGNVYVWHRDRGILLEVLSGHGNGSVNSVAWNPRNKQMFASCSDDFTIRIWEAPPVDTLGQAPSSCLGLRAVEQEPEPSGKGKGKRREPWDED
ncbi:hypothetical protein EW146_g3632 [Bondarzewia mesenterica]|uniref:CTLH domain-containing protein n=1 Tax=Bondarzewia mesenterica TaxID=1095465 RepID=A0A4S4LZ69_9AGAM|nr:hypothetical protein EW146_g3632 [Bondarzewia mesenterica]